MSEPAFEPPGCVLTVENVRSDSPDPPEVNVMREDEGPEPGCRRGDPDIVGGNRRTVAAKIRHDLGVVPAHISIGGEFFDHGVREETPKIVFVLIRPAAEEKSGAQLPKRDGGNPEPLGTVQDLDDGLVPPLEMAVR